MDDETRKRIEELERTVQLIQKKTGIEIKASEIEVTDDPAIFGQPGVTFLLHFLKCELCQAANAKRRSAS